MSSVRKILSYFSGAQLDQKQQDLLESTVKGASLGVASGVILSVFSKAYHHSTVQEAALCVASLSMLGASVGYVNALFDAKAEQAKKVKKAEEINYEPIVSKDESEDDASLPTDPFVRAKSF